MNKNEFVKIADAIRTYYPRDNVMPNKQAMALWYEELKDLPYEVVVMSLRKHVNTSKWSPTIADLRRGASTITTESTDWGKGWDECQRAIRKFGFYREKEAMESMSELTRQTVKRLGWQSLCMSENQMADRANFRDVFNQVQSHENESQSLSESLRTMIGGLNAISDSRSVGRIE